MYDVSDSRVTLRVKISMRRQFIEQLDDYIIVDFIKCSNVDCNFNESQFNITKLL